MPNMVPPGAHSVATKKLNMAYRELIRGVITEERWAKGIERLWRRVEEDGDFRTFLAIAPYIAGPPTVEIAIDVDVKHRVLDWLQPWQPPVQVIDSPVVDLLSASTEDDDPT